MPWPSELHIHPRTCFKARKRHQVNRSWEATLHHLCRGETNVQQPIKSRFRQIRAKQPHWRSGLFGSEEPNYSEWLKWQPLYDQFYRLQNEQQLQIFGQTKEQTAKKFEHFLAWFERRFCCRVQVLRTDGALSIKTLTPFARSPALQDSRPSQITQLQMKTPNTCIEQS